MWAGFCVGAFSEITIFPFHSFCRLPRKFVLEELVSGGCLALRIFRAIMATVLHHAWTTKTSPGSRGFFFSWGGQLVSQMRALRCHRRFVPGLRAGLAALSCLPPRWRPLFSASAGATYGRLLRAGVLPARGLRTTAGQGAEGSDPLTFAPHPAVILKVTDGRAAYLLGFTPFVGAATFVSGQGLDLGALLRVRHGFCVAGSLSPS